MGSKKDKILIQINNARDKLYDDIFHVEVYYLLFSEINGEYSKFVRIHTIQDIINSILESIENE